ncbi:Y-family DNA polymerase [Salinispira pacifica]
MGLLACVNVPQLKLQLYGRHHPELRTDPMAVISEDKPLGIILEANRTALAQGVRPGMRYASALSLVPGLHAAAIPAAEVEDTILALTNMLRDFSPSVEPACFDAVRTGALQRQRTRISPAARHGSSLLIGAGTFWLNADGLERIFGSPGVWAAEIGRALVERPPAPAAPQSTDGSDAPGFTSVVAVGRTRFGTYAASRLRREVTVFESRAEEQEIIRRAPLRILPFDPSTAETLFRLGIQTVRDFIALPYGGVRKRFGEDVAAVHRFAQGLGTIPVQTLAAVDPLARSRRFTSPVANRSYVTIACIQLLEELHAEASRRRELIKEVQLDVGFEPGWQGEEPEPLSALLRPAAPTGDRALLSKLISLRIDGLTFSHPVREISLSLLLQRAQHDQTELFASRPERDSAAANRAFALIRAELGNDSVCTARLLPEHLPRARFRWEPMEHLPQNAVHREAAARKPLLRVRRLFGSPQVLSPSLTPKHDGESPEALYFSGTWWDHPYQVEYRYARLEDGTILWLEQRDDRWIIQGAVE